MNSKEHYEREVSSSKGENKVKKVYVTAEKTILVEQLKEFVEEVIKDKKKSGSKSKFSYSKPYTVKIDNLAMLARYQPPKLFKIKNKIIEMKDYT